MSPDATTVRRPRDAVCHYRRDATVIPPGRFYTGMTVVVDIDCPACGETQSVRKVGIGRYECGECGNAFDQSAVGP